MLATPIMRLGGGLHQGWHRLQHQHQLTIKSVSPPALVSRQPAPTMIVLQPAWPLARWTIIWCPPSLPPPPMPPWMLRFSSHLMALLSQQNLPGCTSLTSVLSSTMACSAIVPPLADAKVIMPFLDQRTAVDAVASKSTRFWFAMAIYFIAGWSRRNGMVVPW